MKSKFAASPNHGGNRTTFVGGEMVLLRNTVTMNKGVDFRTAKQRELGSDVYAEPILKSVLEFTLVTPESLIHKVKVIDSDKKDGTVPNLAVFIFNDLR